MIKKYVLLLIVCLSLLGLTTLKNVNAQTQEEIVNNVNAQTPEDILVNYNTRIAYSMYYDENTEWFAMVPSGTILTQYDKTNDTYRFIGCNFQFVYYEDNVGLQEYTFEKDISEINILLEPSPHAFKYYLRIQSSYSLGVMYLSLDLYGRMMDGENTESTNEIFISNFGNWQTNIIGSQYSPRFIFNVGLENHRYNSLELSEQFSAGYQQGFVNGQQTGYTDGLTVGYDEGHSEGLNQGYESGHLDGYNTGYYEGLEVAENDFQTLFYGIADAPITILASVLSFEIFGINAYILLFSFLTVLILLWLLKKFRG